MFLEKLLTIEERYEKLTGMMVDPKVLSAPQEYQKYSKEQSDLRPLVEKIREYIKLLSDMEGAEEILKGSDNEMRELAQAELNELKEKKPRIEEELRIMLLPRDPRDDKNVILEIRAAQAVRRPLFLQQACSGCTPSMQRQRDGKLM